MKYILICGRFIYFKIDIQSLKVTLLSTCSLNTVMFSMYCFWSIRLTRLSSWSTSQTKFQDGKQIHVASCKLQLYGKWLEVSWDSSVKKQVKHHQCKTAEGGNKPAGPTTFIKCQ